MFGLVGGLFNDLDDFFIGRFFIGERGLFSWSEFPLRVVHFGGLKIVWDCNVNSGVGQLLILNPLILIDKVIGSEAIVLVRGLRRVPPGSIATSPFAHGL